MIFWIPPAAAVVLALFYLFSPEPARLSKVVVVGILVLALLLQFGTASVGGWLLGLLLNVGVAIYIALYLRLGL